MSESDKILDAMSILQDFALASSGDATAKERLEKRPVLPDGIKAWIQKSNVVPPPEPKKEEVKPPASSVCIKCGKDPCECSKSAKEPSNPFKRPSKEDFKDEGEFSKASLEYANFVADIRSQIEGPLGESIKKTIVPDRAPQEQVDILKMMKDADEALDFRDMLRKSGLIDV